MATAQEILAKIKESKRKENEKLFRVVENGSNRHSSNLSTTTVDGSLHRLYSIEDIATEAQETNLYLHWQAKILSIHLANERKFVLPLSVVRRKQLYRTMFPRVTMRLNSCTWYVPELVSYIALHCTYIQQVPDIQSEYLTGITKEQQKVIYSYLLKYKEQHNASNKLDQCNSN